MSYGASFLRIRTAVRILKGEYLMKQYQKPEVFFENFTLAEHIAQCGYQINMADPSDCAIIEDRFDDGFNLAGGFAKTTDVGGSCSFLVDYYCYTNGAAGMPKIFQS